METLKDYHDFYLTSDVLLLADVFETFRDNCMDNYHLDPAPGFSWQAALKMSKVELELLSDIDMHLFLEDGIRGGVSTITHRHATANNILAENFDSSHPSTHLIYWDANNLYGWAMSKSLPTHNFRWLNENEIEDFNIEKIEEDGEDGYILEVDLGKSYIYIYSVFTMKK